MAMAGIYRRVLPSPPAIDFASTSGKELFLEAVQNGTMEGFYKLISHFQTQSEPAYCGLASLSMVLNALAIDPGRTWKGPWRWFDESMLDCCEPLEKVKSKGISFRKLECLAHCAGANVRAIHTNESSIDEFRSYVERCSKSDACHVISSYHRGIFKQTGSGHFSPIGGYHARKDMALILDVARFKYPPHWVPLPLLWDAMSTVDKASGQHRGYMLVSRQQLEPSVLYTLSCKHESWENIAKYLIEDVPLLLKSLSIRTIEGIISCVCMSMPTNFRDFIKWVAEVRRHEDAGQNLSEDEIQRLELKEELLKQVKDTGLYNYVTRFLSSAYQCSTKAAKLGCEYTLSDIAGSLCCEGAELLIGHPTSSRRFRCPKTSVGSLKGDGTRSVTVVTGTVMDGVNKQGLQLLVPGTQITSVCCFDVGDCEGSHPTGRDVLTVLLLALPMHTWTGIKDAKLLMELKSLISAENLPSLLKKEVLHLRRQLALLKRCQNNNVDGNIHTPLS